jgi:hypothetical protein
MMHMSASTDQVRGDAAGMVTRAIVAGSLRRSEVVPLNVDRSGNLSFSIRQLE